MNIKPCKTCANKAQFQDGTPACALHKRQIDLEKDFCSWHKPENQTTQCAVCNRPFNNDDLFYWLNQDETVSYWICQDCLNQIGTCNTCRFIGECGFANDHSEPQIVMKTIRQGFTTIQTQGKNPNLIQKHCISCRCGNGEDCMRDEQGVNCGHFMLR